MPKIQPRPLTKWEQANKASQQAAQALKQQKIEQYRTMKHGAATRPLRGLEAQFVAWTPKQ